MEGRKVAGNGGEWEKDKCASALKCSGEINAAEINVNVNVNPK